MQSARAGLIAIIVMSILLALFPLIVNTIDTVLYNYGQTKTLSATKRSSGLATGVKILIPQVESHVGADRLVVTPGKAIVPPNSTIDVVIHVYFKHSQPCSHPNWYVDYSVQGNLEVISDDGGKLVDPKTYERVLKVKVLGPGIIVVTYHYGSGCPEGTIEQVRVELLTPTENISTTRVENSTVATGEEKYIHISGIVSLKDITHKLLKISGKVVYVRGRWIVARMNQLLDSTEVVRRIPVGAYVNVVCKLTKTGKLQAVKIIVNNRTVYVRS